MTRLAESPDVGIQAESMAVYSYTVRQGGIAADEQDQVGAELELSPTLLARALADLLTLRLLREDREGGRVRYVPVSPEVAAASLIAPIGDEIHRRRAEISRIRAQLDEFRPQYDRLRTGAAAGGGIVALHDANEMAGHLHLALQRCRRDILGFRPEGWLGLDRAIELARQGVSVRLLLSHVRRSDLRVRAQLKDLVAGGGEIRTTGPLPQQLIVFDDEVAFLLHDESPAGPIGVVIRHADTVRLLRDLAEPTWDAAQAYSPVGIGYHDAADSMQQSIVELLANGFTDEAIARRLGISVRTCRRHIAGMLADLDAVSRFQAGVMATAAGMIDPRRLRVTTLPISRVAG
ncbi:LuxR C-terminal-related transcriptional regulator [Micromonospora sp. NPDC049044]|uniref:helix-turn-helix transcriptional regulator n=1 Tax=unclassified Micromonospora TaxID=2617518 RepID=UPI0033DC38B8